MRFMHRCDYKRSIDADIIVQISRFSAPVEQIKSGEYGMNPNQTIFLYFSSDSLIEDANPRRNECWSMMKELSDSNFIFSHKKDRPT